jgi:hypothetical protein
MNKKFKEDLSNLLSTIYKDADMAINGEWDKSDDGFEAQQTLIDRFCDKYNITLNLEEGRKNESE